jgi:UDP-2,4-diacetamido-2,4,6-trideoxy-beta-L-altropyranose hydrolase
MNVCIRADASIRIGTGHIMRCLTLATELRKKGANVFFICAGLEGNLVSFIKNKGFQAYLVPFNRELLDNDPFYDTSLNLAWKIDAEQTLAILGKQKDELDWLIVDHYKLDVQWEREFRSHVNKIMVIDDLADRFHDCDLLLDQNLYHDMDKRYGDLVPNQCQKLLGPQYALLRSEFWEARNQRVDRDGTIHRILIFFGGTDPTNETCKALEAICLLNRKDISVDVVVGASNPQKEEIDKRCSNIPNVTYYCQVENMAQLMVEADLAIGAGGSTTWERCCLGLPSITVIVAKNQHEMTLAFAEAGGTWNLGSGETVNSVHLLQTIEKALNNPREIKEMGKKAMRLIGDMPNNKSLIQHMMGENNAISK